MASWGKPFGEKWDTDEGKGIFRSSSKNQLEEVDTNAALVEIMTTSHHHEDTGTENVYNMPNAIRQILLENPNCRTGEETELLIEYTSRFGCLGGLPEGIHRSICREALGMREFKEGDVIYEIGEYSLSGLHIVVEGKVKITQEDTNPLLEFVWPGQSFGEKALLGDSNRNSHRRAESASALQTPTILMTVGVDDYERLRVSQQLVLAEKLGCPPSSLPLLAHYLRPLSFSPNRLIVKQGDQPSGLYFITKGSVQLLKSLKVGQEKHPHKPVDFNFLHSVMAWEPRKEMLREKKRNRPQTAPPSYSKSVPRKQVRPKSPIRPKSAAPFSSETPPWVSSRTTSKLLRVGTLHEGDFFGAKAITNNCPEPLSVMTQGKVELLMLDKGRIGQAMGVNSKGDSSRNRGYSARLWTMLKQSAAESPEDSEIRLKYYQHRAWERYKKGLVEGIVKEHKQAQAKRSGNLWGVPFR